MAKWSDIWTNDSLTRGQKHVAMIVARNTRPSEPKTNGEPRYYPHKQPARYRKGAPA